MTTDSRLEALLSIPALAAPAVSPDGTWVAWSLSRVGPAADVFAAPVDGSVAPVRMTDTPDDTFVVSWTPDSESVVVEEDHDGDERARLFRVRLDAPGVMEPLTEEAPDYFLQGGQLHPDGRWLVYGANFDFEVGKEIEATWIQRHDLETNERHVLARPERSAFVEPQLSPTGDHVLYHRSDEHPEGLQLWLVNIEGREDHEILNFGPRTKVSASWFLDGKRILFVAETATHRRVGVWENSEVRWLLDDPKRDVEYAFALPNGGPVVAVEIISAGVRASLLDAENVEESHLPEIDGNLVPLSPIDGGGWIVLRYDARHPVDLVRWDPSSRPTSVTGLPDLTIVDKDSLTSAEDFRWTSVDEMEIQGWLYRAPLESVGTVVLVHGGPTSHAEDRFNAQIQYLVSRGFHVLTPNYRGSTGFGLAFQESIKEDGWGGREQEDIRAGIQALIKSGISEAGKVGITGTSYGGYSAWWAITHWPISVVAASAPICGMTDLVVDYHTTRPDLRPYSEEMMGGTPDDVPDRYHERSPINSVANIHGKLLVIQGQKDPNVTPENVHAVEKALKNHDIPYNLLAFEDEGHGIARPQNLRTLYSRLANFFEGAFTDG
jgi:dipeptidyl aminopeptidase/acylaminoacyl peptidase